MREMKDSGVEWIGAIPVNHSLLRNKYLFEYVKGKIPNSTNTDQIGYPYIGASDLDTYEEYNTFTTDEDIPSCRYDDLLVLWDGARAGLCGTHKVGRISSTIVRLRAKASYPSYLYWYYKGFESFMYQLVNGTTIPHMNRRYIEQIGWIDWSLKEQEKISTYLNTKCSKIDNIIAREQAVIEKLKEYKLSVITEVVTKGLNPDVPMKDSGVEWIGEIPQYWDISHIGNLAEIGSGGTPDRKKSEYWENGSIRWMASGEINYEFVYDTAEKITEQGMQNSNAKLLPINTVMLGLIGQGKTKGLTAILKNECTCNQNLAYLIPYDYLLYYEYLFYCFKGMYIFIRGIVGDSQAGIYQNFLKKQYIPLPTIDEQKEICKILNSKCSKIDASMKKKELLITKLTEYKKSLIYEVVTGKKEV